jgi:hypothetical protein
MPPRHWVKPELHFIGWRPSRAPPSPGEARDALRWVEAESRRRVEAESRTAVCGRVAHRLVEDEVAGHRFAAARVEVREEWLSLIRC